MQVRHTALICGRQFCWFLLVALLFLPSCKSTSVGTLSPLSVSDEAELQKHLLNLKVRYRLLDSMRTYMSVQIKTPEGTQEVREILRYAYPDKLRVDVLGVATSTKAVILAVDGLFTLFLPQENEAIQDKLSDQVLTEIFGIDLRISDVRSALFANPFLDGEISNLRGLRTGDLFRIQRASSRPEHWEEIEISTSGDRPLVQSWKLFDSQNRVVQESEFQDYREIGGLMLAFATVVTRPLQQTTVTFRISPDQTELHPQFGSKTFDFDLSNARIRKAGS